MLGEGIIQLTKVLALELAEYDISSGLLPAANQFIKKGEI